jgi:hypothetical protein
MHSSSNGKVQQAVRDCVARCQSHDEPVACIALFVKDLRQNPTWRDSEILEVQLAVFRFMAAMHRESA